MNIHVDTIITIAHNCPKSKYFKFQIIDHYIEQDVPYHVFRELKYLVNLEHLNIPRVIEIADDGNSLMSITLPITMNLNT